MTLTASDNGGGDFKKVPEGTHQAVCDMVVDLGNQVTEYNGEKSIKSQVFIRWQVPSMRVQYTDKDGNEVEGPMSIGKVYTNSLSEKANLRKDLQGWRNRAFTKDELKGFDIRKVAGTCCQIIVTHREGRNGNVYANVTGVAGWPGGLPRIEAEGETVIYSGEDNVGSLEKLPKWLREKVENQATGQELYDDRDQYLNGAQPSAHPPAGGHPADFDDQEIPF